MGVPAIPDVLEAIVRGERSFEPLRDRSASHDQRDLDGLDSGMVDLRLGVGKDRNVDRAGGGCT